VQLNVSRRATANALEQVQLQLPVFLVRGTSAVF